MAEFISVELMLMIARDVYMVSKWAYDTVCVAQQHQEHLTTLKKRFEAQVSIIRGFTRMYLRDLPPNDVESQSWLLDVKLKYEELQELLAGRWARLALKYDLNYRQFNTFYTRALEMEPGQLGLHHSPSQWLLEDVTPTAVTVQTLSANGLIPLVENINL